MLLREIFRITPSRKSSDKLFQVTYYTGPNQERSRTIYASSKEAAKEEISKYGRVHKITELPTGYGRAVDALRFGRDRGNRTHKPEGTKF